MDFADTYVSDHMKMEAYDLYINETKIVMSKLCIIFKFL